MSSVIVHTRLWCYTYIFVYAFVAVPSPPVVRVNPFNSVTLTLAGESLTVICSVIPQNGIMYNNTLTLMWTGDGGTPLPSGESFGPIIRLSPVHTSHGGEYTCTARLNIPEARVDVSGTNTTAINVQSMKTHYQVYIVSIC